MNFEADEIETFDHPNEKEGWSFQCLEIESTDNFLGKEDCVLGEVRRESGADKMVEKELKHESDRNDNSTRIPRCDQDDLYSSWKREKSLCEKWQEGEGELVSEMETRNLREHVGDKEREDVMEMAKEKRAEIMELSDVSIKESVVELSLEMREMEEEVNQQHEEEDIERMIKEEMMEENKVRDSLMMEKLRIVEERMIKSEVTEEERVIEEEMLDMESTGRRQIECNYCQQKEGEVRQKTKIQKNETN